MEILQLILHWPFLTRLIHIVGGGPPDNAFYHFCYVRSRSCVTAFKLSTSLYQICYSLSWVSNTKTCYFNNEIQNPPLVFSMSMETPESKMSGTLLHRSQNSKLKVGRSVVECETVVAASTLGLRERGELRSVSIKAITHLLLPLIHMSHKRRNICCTLKTTRLQKRCSAFHP